MAHSAEKELLAVIRAGEKPEPRINVETYQRTPVPIHCNHCDNPPCMAACATGAIHRDGDSGPVLVDAERCIGCKMCVQACPFGVLTMRANGKGVLKCDLCAERLAEGMEPACVTACPTNALTFGDEEEANKAKRRKTAERMLAAHEEEARTP